MNYEVEVAIKNIAKEIGEIKDIIAAAFPPADKRPLAERLAEVTEGVFASLDAEAKSRVSRDIKIT